MVFLNMKECNVKITPSLTFNFFMKKSTKILITFSVFSALFIFGCSAKNYTQDISYMPKDIQAKNEKMLTDALTKYNGETDPAKKVKDADEVGFRYMTLGKYSDSMKYYEEILKSDPTNYQALNNIAYMYETVGEKQKALTYEQKLYEAYSTNPNVILDVIRLLIANNQASDAQGVLETFAKTDAGKKEAAFISDQYKIIRKAMNLVVNPTSGTKTK